MNIDFTKTAGMITLLVLIQVLVLNNIHLFGYATPLLYVYVIIRSNNGWSRWATLLVGFFTGLICDIFANTPGVSAASMTLVAMLKPSVLSMFANYETPENMEPTITSMGISKYISYCITLIVVFCLAFFTLEEFAFFHWQRWLLCILGSIIITTVFILAIENLRTKKI